MSDKEEIRNLVEKYADAVCRRDEADWASTWAEDAVWDLSSMPPVKGKKDIVALWVQAMSGFPFAGQLIQNGTVKYGNWSKRYDNNGEYQRRYVTWPWGEIEREITRS